MTDDGLAWAQEPGPKSVRLAHTVGVAGQCCVGLTGQGGGEGGQGGRGGIPQTNVIQSLLCMKKATLASLASGAS